MSTGTPAPSELSQDRETQIRAAQTQLLYTNAPAAMLTGMVNGAILIAVLRATVSQAVLAGWAAALLTTTLARYLLVLRFRRLQPGPDAIDRWGAYLTWGMAVAGLIWGGAGLLLFPADAPTQQMFLCFVVGGMVAGAAGALSAQLKAFFAYAVPAVVPLCARVVSERDELHVVMAIMLLLFAAVMSVAAVRNRNLTSASIGLRFEKDQLLASLAEAKDGAESLNAVLQRRTRELERVNSELRSFAYSVSHELRAPLRAIAGFSAVLVDDCAQRLDATGRDHLGRISRAAVQMARMIDALLTLSRVTRGGLNRESVDLTAMAKRAAAELQEAEPKRRIEIAIEDDLVADCDRQLVQRVLGNLLGNSTKFTRLVPEALIEFGALATEGRRTYFVRDNGAGFDLAHARQLFLPFHRLHVDSEFPGDGVGLATVQRIIQRHGGEVWADGAVGKGATFYFTLEPRPSSEARSASPGAGHC